MLRVARDHEWAVYPPAVDAGIDVPVAYPGARPFVEPGKSVTVTTTAANSGKRPAMFVRNALSASDGWSVQATSPETKTLVDSGDQLATTWTVQVPAGAKPGSYDLTATTTYEPDESSSQSRIQVDVLNTTPPPSGTSYLSDVPWLRADSGWGPIEKDTSNGESAAGDGHPITINGTVYKKGLGAHAPSSIEYYTAKKCTSVSSDVGVDDEKTVNGSVTFEIWADGTKVADSGLLTTADDAKHLTADVTGSTFVRLVVTDGGNGNDSDHADWADARLVCT
jgi:alpha-galactosidase